MITGSTLSIAGLALGPLAMICLAVSVFSAILYGLICTFVPAPPARTVVKTLSVSALTGAAFFTDGPLFLILALAASSFGDFFLAAPGEKRFLGGVASFAIAHLAYVALFLQFGADFSMVSTGRILLILALIGLSAFLLSGSSGSIWEP